MRQQRISKRSDWFGWLLAAQRCCISVAWLLPSFRHRGGCIVVCRGRWSRRKTLRHWGGWLWASRHHVVCHHFHTAKWIHLNITRTKRTVQRGCNWRHQQSTTMADGWRFWCNGITNCGGCIRIHGTLLWCRRTFAGALLMVSVEQHLPF